MEKIVSAITMLYLISSADLTLQYKERHFEIFGNGKTIIIPKKPKKKLTLLHPVSDSDSDSDDVEMSSSNAPTNDPKKPWLADFHQYLNTVEHIDDSISTVQWWGVSGILSSLCKFFTEATCFVHSLDPCKSVSCMGVAGPRLSIDHGNISLK